MAKSVNVVFAAMLMATAAVETSWALPEDPVRGLPMVYDAKDKLIGPYYAGVTYITIQNQAYSLPIGRFRFPTGPDYVLNLYYAKEGCKGDAYTTTTNPGLGLTPSVYPNNGNIYFASGLPKTQTLKSVITINLSGSVCQSIFLKDATVFNMTKKPESFLGIEFPVRISLPK